MSAVTNFQKNFFRTQTAIFWQNDLVKLVAAIYSVFVFVTRRWKCQKINPQFAGCDVKNSWKEECSLSFFGTSSIQHLCGFVTDRFHVLLLTLCLTFWKNLKKADHLQLWIIQLRGESFFSKQKVPLICYIISRLTQQSSFLSWENKDLRTTE